MSEEEEAADDPPRKARSANIHDSEPSSVLQFLRTMADLFNLLPRDDRVLSFWYILEVAKPDPQAVQSALRDVVEPRALEDIMTAADKLRYDAQRELFVKLLGNRFGRLSPGAEERVLTADEGRLDEWSGRMWTATTLDELLGSD